VKNQSQKHYLFRKIPNIFSLKQPNFVCDCLSRTNYLYLQKIIAMRKKLLMGLLTLFICTAVCAQKNYKADKRLYDVFSSEYIAQLEASKSELIPYYNYYLDNSYYVVTLKSAAKQLTGLDIHIVTSAVSQTTQNFNEKTYSRETFNVLKYNFDVSSKNFITYIWNEAGIAVVFKPLLYISAGYKKFSKQQ